MLNAVIQVPETGELSTIGTAYLAGLSSSIFREDVLDSLKRHSYIPAMSLKLRK
ncbi:MAG: hypothetical protein HFI33_05955 [Lachnospiraceae bacterium]|nr:hypothetical protein [Lachnospiraceae bacterium]